MRKRIVVHDEVVNALFDDLRKANVGIFRHNDGTQYVGAFDGDRLIGIAGFKRREKTIQYVRDFVLPQYRKQGVFAELWQYRERMIQEAIQANKWTIRERNAFCSSDALLMYLKNGFDKAGQFTAGIIQFVTKQEKR